MTMEVWSLHWFQAREHLIANEFRGAKLEKRIGGSARLTGDSVAGESPAGRRRPATTSTPSHGPFIREGRG